MVAQTQKMEIKSGYKITEVGVIPEDWTVKSFQELGQLDSENLPSNTDPNYEFNYISIDDVDHGILEKWTKLKFKDAPSRARRKLSYDDILISTVRPNLQSHYIMQMKSNNFVCSTGFSVLRGYDNVDPHFVYYHLFSNIIDNQINRMLIGSNYPSLNRNDVAKLKIPIPTSIKEQLLISEILSRIDALITSLDCLLEKKKNIKQGAMQELLTGKKRLSGFNENWVDMELGDIANIKDGTHQTPTYVSHGIPFYSVENVTNDNFTLTKYISEREHKLLTKSFKIEKGDILMTRIGSIGDCKLIDWDVNASFYVSLALLKIRKGVSSAFVYQYSKSNSFKKEVELKSLQWAVPKKINLGDISDIKIRIPISEEEQNVIANVLSNMDDEIEQLEKTRDKYLMIKKGMMQKLLTGEIRLQ